jgi:hypothetical protein
MLTCLRCGTESPDVLMALVDLEEEAKRDGTTIRVVEVETVEQLRHVNVVHRVMAPERFGCEWRCRDRDACERRYREWSKPEPMDVPTPDPVDEELPEWLL